MHRPEPQSFPDSPKSDSFALAFGALLIGNMALAFGGWFVRLADVGPVAAGFWRLALAAPVLILATLGSGWPFRRLGAGLGWVLAVAGICFAADLASWHLGILRTTLANATLLGNSATLFYPIYGFVIARALPSRNQALALAFAAIGAALLMGRSYELSPRNLAGDALCLAAGLLYTGFFILMARARTVLPPLPALTLSSIASIVPLLVIALLLGERIWPHHWAPLIGLAFASQVLGQGMMIYALGKLSPLPIGIALLTQPIIAGTIGWLGYGEAPAPADLAGPALVAVALLLVRRREPTLPIARLGPRSAA